MHPNPGFRQTPGEQSIAFARGRGFGTLCLGGERPLVSHVPFRLSPDTGRIEMHLVRSNPIAGALSAPRPAVLAVTGPHSYVSPDWYGIEDQVPTWNYVAVHFRGALELRPAEELRDHLERLSASFEERLAKPPWRLDKMDEDRLARMMRMIVPVRLAVEQVQSTWKLGQNKPEAARLAAAAGVAGQGMGEDTATLADLMRLPPG